MADSGNRRFQLDRIGVMVRSAREQLGVETTFCADDDALPHGGETREVRLADGRRCAALYLRDGSASREQKRGMSLVAEVLADDIQQHLQLAPENFGDRVRHVIDNGLATAVLQPIVKLATGRVVGVEALARFPGDPGRGASVWFAQADSTGLGQELELMAARAALAHLDSIPDECFLTINVSPTTLASDQFTELLQGQPLDRLVIEMTEHSPVRDYESLRKVIAVHRENGLRLAIDDAGAGFASLNHILALSPDTIKLDISLIRGVDSNAHKRALVRALVSFAEAIDADCVAEGIESPEELSALRELGVGMGQGFLLGKPSASPAQLFTETRAESASASIGQAVDDHMLQSVASQFGLKLAEARALSAESRSAMWKRVAFDELTGTLQRGFGLATLEREVARAHRQLQPLSVAFIDIDGLKAVNDLEGHVAGDRLLRAFGAAALARLRREDLMFRYGGDEFVCVLPSAALHEATRIMARIRGAARGAGVVFSCGLAELQRGEDADHLLHRADTRMYRDKRRRSLRPTSSS